MLLRFFFQARRVFGIGILLLLISSGCGGIPETSILECSGPPPNKVYSKGVILNDRKFYQIFSKAEEFACLTITWSGQKNAPRAYLAKVSKDGTYQIFDQKTKQFTTEKLGATVAAGVDKVDVTLLFYKVANAQEAQQLNCATLVKGGLSGCWGDQRCTFAMQNKDVPTNGSAAQCKFCSRELCNGKDDDCNGQIDDGTPAACGSLMNRPCKYYPKVQVTGEPCTAQSKCTCLVTPPGQIYVCGGQPGQKPQWKNISNVNSLCIERNDGKFYNCGQEKLICDTCGKNSKRSWRATTPGKCNDGTLHYTK